jgi:hypothetical protein
VIQVFKAKSELPGVSKIVGGAVFLRKTALGSGGFPYSNSDFAPVPAFDGAFLSRGKKAGIVICQPPRYGSNVRGSDDSLWHKVEKRDSHFGAPPATPSLDHYSLFKKLLSFAVVVQDVCHAHVLLDRNAIPGAVI